MLDDNNAKLHSFVGKLLAGDAPSMAKLAATAAQWTRADSRSIERMLNMCRQLRLSVDRLMRMLMEHVDDGDEKEDIIGRILSYGVEQLIEGEEECSRDVVNLVVTHAHNATADTITKWALVVWDKDDCATLATSIVQVFNASQDEEDGLDLVERIVQRCARHAIMSAAITSTLHKASITSSLCLQLHLSLESSAVVLRSAFTNCARHDAMHAAHEWCDQIIPQDGHRTLTLMMDDVVDNRLSNADKRCQSIVHGCIALALDLLDHNLGHVTIVDGQLRSDDSSVSSRLCSLATSILRRCVAYNTEHTDEMFRHLLDVGVTKTAFFFIDVLSTLIGQHYKQLTKLSLNVRAIEDCIKCSVRLPPSIGRALLKALLPLVRRHKLLRRTLFDTMKRALFDGRNSDGRLVAVHGLLLLLKQWPSTQGHLSSSQVIHSFPTFASQVYHNTCQMDESSENESTAAKEDFLWLEVVSCLRRCLTMKADVKNILYTGLCDATLVNEKLLAPVTEMLRQQLHELVNPTILVNRLCEDDAVLEPIADLVQALYRCCFTCRQVQQQCTDTTEAAQYRSIVKVIRGEISKLASRLGDINLDELYISTTTEARTVMQLYTAVMEAVWWLMSVCSRPISARTFLALNKRRARLQHGHKLPVDTTMQLRTMHSLVTHLLTDVQPEHEESLGVLRNDVDLMSFVLQSTLDMVSTTAHQSTSIDHVIAMARPLFDLFIGRHAHLAAHWSDQQRSTVFHEQRSRALHIYAAILHRVDERHPSRMYDTLVGVLRVDGQLVEGEQKMDSIEGIVVLHIRLLLDKLGDTSVGVEMSTTVGGGGKRRHNDTTISPPVSRQQANLRICQSIVHAVGCLLKHLPTRSTPLQSVFALMQRLLNECAIGQSYTNIDRCCLSSENPSVVTSMWRLLLSTNGRVDHLDVDDNNAGCRLLRRIAVDLLAHGNHKDTFETIRPREPPSKVGMVARLANENGRHAVTVLLCHTMASYFDTIAQIYPTFDPDDQDSTSPQIVCQFVRQLSMAVGRILQLSDDDDTTIAHAQIHLATRAYIAFCVIVKHTATATKCIISTAVHVALHVSAIVDVCFDDRLDHVGTAQMNKQREMYDRLLLKLAMATNNAHLLKAARRLSANRDFRIDQRAAISALDRMEEEVSDSA